MRVTGTLNPTVETKEATSRASRGQMMRRLLAGLLLAVLAGAAIAAPATARRRPTERIVKSPYRTPVLGVAIGAENQAYYYDCLQQIGCAILPVKAKDRFVRLEILDASGGETFGAIYAMPGGDHVGNFCGATKQPLFIRGVQELLVHVISGFCPGGSTPSTATTGFVTGIFTKRAS